MIAKEQLTARRPAVLPVKPWQLPSAFFKNRIRFVRSRDVAIGFI